MGTNYFCMEHGPLGDTRVCDACDIVAKANSVNHPPHYTAHPSGVECIQITEHMNFNLGNALKYIWRADLKNDAIEDLKKAIWYIERELKKREKK
jgi:hypothetical protein